MTNGEFPLYERSTAVFFFSVFCYNPPSTLRSTDLPIPQTRVKDLLDSALALKRIIDEMKESAERTLSDPSADGRALAILITETSIPDSVIETLAVERTHQSLTWKRNQSNARSLRRRRRQENVTEAEVLEFNE